jgi:hypothetical protein
MALHQIRPSLPLCFVVGLRRVAALAVLRKAKTALLCTFIDLRFTYAVHSRRGVPLRYKSNVQALLQLVFRAGAGAKEARHGTVLP